MLLSELMSPDRLAEAIADGDVQQRRHPHYRLSLYTYTRACQYGRHWDACTMACRGLVVDELTNQVVARPFPKFFNLDEHALGYDWAPPVPQDAWLGDVDVYEKMDGSLGIVFQYAGRWLAASKGSFISEQAQWAQTRLDASGQLTCPTWWGPQPRTRHLVPGNTYLCELVYPANRIVVDYGPQESMTLLGVYGPDGREQLLNDTHRAQWAPIGPVVRKHDPRPLYALAELARTNKNPDGGTVTGTDHEGFVVRFRHGGRRVKVKYGEYVRLHKVLTGVTAVDVWRALAVAVLRDELDAKRLAQTVACSPKDIESLLQVPDPIGSLLDGVPDEFDGWVRGVVADLNGNAEKLTSRITTRWDQLRHLLPDRKRFAEGALTAPPELRAGLFMLADGKSLMAHVWKTVKPAAATPFREDNDS